MYVLRIVSLAAFIVFSDITAQLVARYKITGAGTQALVMRGLSFSKNGRYIVFPSHSLVISQVVYF